MVTQTVYWVLALLSSLIGQSTGAGGSDGAVSPTPPTPNTHTQSCTQPETLIICIIPAKLLEGGKKGGRSLCFLFWKLMSNLEGVTSELTNTF